MKITIVMGFFLPMPPAKGGATEKTWDRLAREFATRGHEVTIVSRAWPGWPQQEVQHRVTYRRIPGYNHRRRLWQNLLLDLRWSLRVRSILPPADVTIVHAVSLPVWLGRSRPEAGRVVVMPGRMPKGQYRFYRNIARVLATSTPVAERIQQENPAVAKVARVVGYPINWQLLAAAQPARVSPVVTIGYAGRIHPEKGLDLLVAAMVKLATDASLPRWQFVARGPVDVAAGGGGGEYAARLRQRLGARLVPDQWALLPPIFEETGLAEFYRSLDIFCYPSLAVGETFGVAVAEAMAARVVPVTSNLPCFRDFLRPGENGVTFDHTAPDAADRLAEQLASLLREPARRQLLATTAQADVRRYGYVEYTDALLDDLSQLAHRATLSPAGPS